mgnify:CR=1 FL=1
MGLKTLAVGGVGEDMMGDWVLERLKSFGVDVSAMQRKLTGVDSQLGTLSTRTTAEDVRSAIDATLRPELKQVGQQFVALQQQHRQRPPRMSLPPRPAQRKHLTQPLEKHRRQNQGGAVRGPTAKGCSSGCGCRRYGAADATK